MKKYNSVLLFQLVTMLIVAIIAISIEFKMIIGIFIVSIIHIISILIGAFYFKYSKNYGIKNIFVMCFIISFFTDFHTFSANIQDGCFFNIIHSSNHSFLSSSCILMTTLAGGILQYYFSKNV